MQVSSAPLQPSALDTWLQQSESQEPASLQVAPAAGQGAGGPSRDAAEGLLGLNVWGGNPTAGHRLVATATAPDAGATQLWATHIFAPLE